MYQIYEPSETISVLESLITVVENDIRNAFRDDVILNTLKAVIPPEVFSNDQIVYPLKHADELSISVFNQCVSYDKRYNDIFAVISDIKTSLNIIECGIKQSDNRKILEGLVGLKNQYKIFKLNEKLNVFDILIAEFTKLESVIKNE